MEEIQFFLIKKIQCIGLDKSNEIIKKNKKIYKKFSNVFFKKFCNFFERKLAILL